MSCCSALLELAAPRVCNMRGTQQTSQTNAGTQLRTEQMGRCRGEEGGGAREKREGRGEGGNNARRLPLLYSKELLLNSLNGHPLPTTEEMSVPCDQMNPRLEPPVCTSATQASSRAIFPTALRRTINSALRRHRPGHSLLKYSQHKQASFLTQPGNSKGLSLLFSSN